MIELQGSYTFTVLSGHVELHQSPPEEKYCGALRAYVDMVGLCQQTWPKLGLIYQDNFVKEMFFSFQLQHLTKEEVKFTEEELANEDNESYRKSLTNWTEWAQKYMNTLIMLSTKA
jgi:hypothetical protein